VGQTRHLLQYHYRGRHPGLFLSATLGLRSKTGLLAALTKANIKPGSGYSYASMAAAIKASIGVNPLMGCKTNNTLSEVGVCFSKSLEPVECDASVKSQQGDEVSDCATDVMVNFPGSTGPSPSPPGPATAKCGGTGGYGCGKFIHGAPCQCNDQCHQYENCCPDYDTVCKGPGPSPPTPPTPPSPGDKCVPGQHGPKCSADADCTKITDCIRCASSGYCTSTPKLW